MKCIGGQIKAFSFLFCIACGTKSTRGGELYVHHGECDVQNDCKTKRTDSSNALYVVAKCKKVESVNTQNDYKTTSKKWIDKKKTNMFCEFCKSV